MIDRGDRIALTRMHPDGPGSVAAPDGVQYDSEAEAFYYHVMDLCGCGSPDEVSAFIIECLKAFQEPLTEAPIPKIAALIATDPSIMAEMMAHILDSKGLLEHGSSVYSAWLTDRGKQMIEIGPVKDG